MTFLFAFFLLLLHEPQDLTFFDELDLFISVVKLNSLFLFLRLFEQLKQLCLLGH